MNSANSSIGHHGMLESFQSSRQKHQSMSILLAGPEIFQNFRQRWFGNLMNQVVSLPIVKLSIQQSDIRVVRFLRQSWLDNLMNQDKPSHVKARIYFSEASDKFNALKIDRDFQQFEKCSKGFYFIEMVNVMSCMLSQPIIAYKHFECTQIRTKICFDFKSKNNKSTSIKVFSSFGSW